MKARIYSLVFSILTFAAILGDSIQAQDMSPVDTTQDLASSDWIAMPILYYSPETKMAFGAGGLYFFRDGTAATRSHPSAIGATVEYTQLNQFQFELLPDLSLLDGKYRIEGQAGFRKSPAAYYGRMNGRVVEERYTHQTFYARLNFQRQIASYLTAGCVATYSNRRMMQVEEQGILARGNVVGSKGGVVSGIGATIRLDTRDNSFFPTSGRYYEGSFMTFQKSLGSAFTFNRWSADLRDYYSVGATQVVAVQRYAGIMTGNVPFQNLSMLGGKDILRGYSEGYYNDKNVIAVQADYRVSPIWWKLGFTMFAAAGEVAGRVDRFSLAAIKCSAGFGVRYLLIEKEKLALRVDCAWGQGSSGFYITINEAF